MVNAYLKQKIGKELLELINSNSSITEISLWADRVYSDHCRDLDQETEELITKISFMQHGIEFKLEKAYLKSIAKQLIEK